MEWIGQRVRTSLLTWYLCTEAVAERVQQRRKKKGPLGVAAGYPAMGPCGRFQGSLPPKLTYPFP